MPRKVLLQRKTKKTNIKIELNTDPIPFLNHLLDKKCKPNNIKIEKAGGQTNRNYKVKYKNTIRFVRLPWEAADIVDRKIEAKNTIALVKNKKLSKILPKYYLYIFKRKNILEPRGKKVYDLPDGTMVMEYIEGKDIDGRDLEKPKIQKALLKTLHLFHTSGVRLVNSYDVFRDEVLKYKNKAKKYPINKLFKKETIKEIEEIEKIMREKLKPGGAVSTHNDLIFENLRLGKDGKIYLLDFEYAGFNIRDGLHYDIGIILGGNLFQRNPIKFKTYEEILEKAPKVYKQNFDSYKAYCGALTNILVMFWWGVVKYFSSTTKKEKSYFKKYAFDRAKGIKFLFHIIEKKRKG